MKKIPLLIIAVITAIFLFMPNVLADKGSKEEIECVNKNSERCKKYKQKEIDAIVNNRTNKYINKTRTEIGQEEFKKRVNDCFEENSSDTSKCIDKVTHGGVGGDYGTKTNKNNFQMDVGEINCGDLKAFTDFLASAYLTIEIAAIVITVVLSMVDYSKAVMGSEKVEDAIKTANSNLRTRFVIIFIIVLLPELVRILFNVFNRNICYF